MSKKKKIGDWGEALAAEFLSNAGYQILERNYRHGRHEIDIIAQVEDTLVFVEVKTRSGSKYGFPEDQVDGQKIENIMEASEHFIFEIGWQKTIRYDVIAIVKERQEVEIKHFLDAIN